MKKTLAILSLYALPVVALAQTGAGEDVDSLITAIDRWISALIPILIAAAVLFFFYGLAKFMLAAGDEEKRKDGKNIMIWGIVTLFVMVAVWGLVGFLANTFFGGTSPAAPPAPGTPSP